MRRPAGSFACRFLFFKALITINALDSGLLHKTVRGGEAAGGAVSKEQRE